MALRLKFVLGAATALVSASVAFASETYCGVSERTHDGYVVLRQGPGSNFAPEGSVTPADFLYLDTSQCRSDFGKLRCSHDRDWVFVEKVSSPSGRSSKRGWANSKLIREIACPDELDRTSDSRPGGRPMLPAGAQTISGDAIDSVYQQLNEMCRGWSGDDPHTMEACDLRTKVGDILKRSDWCKAHLKLGECR